MPKIKSIREKITLKRVPLDFKWPLNKPFDEELQTGDGYQMWETIYSYGSPVTPVFENSEDLVEYVYKNGLCEPYDQLTREAARSFVYSKGPQIWTYKDLKILDPTGGKISRTVAPLLYFSNCIEDKYLDNTLRERDIIEYNVLTMIYKVLYKKRDKIIKAVFKFKDELSNKIPPALADYLTQRQLLYKNHPEVEDQETSFLLTNSFVSIYNKFLDDKITPIDTMELNQLIKKYIELDNKFNVLWDEIALFEGELPQLVRESMDTYLETRMKLYPEIAKISQVQ
jgi:hypothetical protein